MYITTDGRRGVGNVAKNCEHLGIQGYRRGRGHRAAEHLHLRSRRRHPPGSQRQTLTGWLALTWMSNFFACSPRRAYRTALHSAYLRGHVSQCPDIRHPT